ncbi:alpha-L-fucosidase [Proteiniphilum sp. UBA1028]|jgi:alpha-L-fucosidase|uniref:alpha-L-fucosidase n=1 Tax=Proteiniphilum sp. UBA1028 TaxID=1947251 RepID=UPI000E7FD0DA|nr:alpha-L-fucosidase [Proteiniphilum sp. UBA1028]HBG57064.1 alpha-1,3/4-fucosidase [Porphyromonadaceae bacterium]
MRKILFPGLWISLLLLSGCNQRTNTYFEKKLTFPNILTSDQKVKLAAYVVPTRQQYEWQQLELTAFIHFGINTFTGREWGDGSESPVLFNPTDFDADQWVSSLKEAGFKMVILTAKHHDGFCLWPTQTTAHSVASSPWRNGQGDVVREVKEACDKHNIKFGVYLSPWDRNAESYGDSPRYNALFVKQLSELLTHYGEIHEVWFDGANGEGPNGRLQEYDWARFYHVIDSLQPAAVKAIMGDDVRWVGNESGLGRETEWSVTPLQPDISEAIAIENKRLNISPTANDLGSRNLIEQTQTLYWYPSEVDVSIRPGWFYHPEQDHQVKSLAQLVDIYFLSVGMNSVLLLNVPPDTRGRLHEVDVERLRQFGTYIASTFENEKLIDGEILWKARSGASKEYHVRAGEIINTVMLQEDIRKGQRVEKFLVEGFINNEWIKLTEGTTIGYKRLLRFKDVTPAKLRITVDKTRDIANIQKVGAYHAPHLEVEAKEDRLTDIAPESWRTIKEHPLIVDLGESHPVKGFTYSPDDAKESVFTYIFSVSGDGQIWEKIIEGEFSNIKNNPLPQRISFNKSVDARFIKLETVNGVDGGKPSVEMYQIGILTK